MRVSLLALPILFFSGVSYSTVIEVWECQKFPSKIQPILVEATVNEGRRTGTISVAGVEYLASFHVDGFMRRWDFGGSNKTGGYTYAFTIAPDGAAHYYDFQLAKTAKPSMTMWCQQRTIS